MHFVEIVDSEFACLTVGERWIRTVGPAAGAADISGPGSCSRKKTGCSVCWRRRGPRDSAVDAGVRNEQGLSSDMMLAYQWRADAIMCVQLL